MSANQAEAPARLDGRRVAVVVGFDYHVNILCSKVNEHSTTWRFIPFPSTRVGSLLAIGRLQSADALISLGGPVPNTMLMAAARIRDLPVVVIWAGTDVLRLNERKTSDALRAEPIHIAIAPWLKDELRAGGIDAEYLPIIGIDSAPTATAPSGDFRVLSYLPEPRRDFYGRSHVYQVAAHVPNVHFDIVGPGGVDPTAPPNVEFHGQVPDLSPLIDRCSLVLRVPQHDGMSLVVLEALARGRFVAWTHRVKGVHQVSSPADSIQYIERLQLDKPLGLNSDGLEFIASSYETGTVAQNLQLYLDQKLEHRATSLARSRRVVVLGLDLFATALSRANNALQTGWRAVVLQPRSRYELLASLYDVAKSDAIYSVGEPVLGRYFRLVAGFLRKPRVIHWVGADIALLQRRPDLVESFTRHSAIHLTEAPWEVRELAFYGIDATIAPLPPRISAPEPIPPLPDTFTVLVYLSQSRPDFYGRRELEALMDELRGHRIRYFIVGGGELTGPPASEVQNLGWNFELGEVYAKSSLLVRFTPRDGLSLMVLEALSFGRHVIWTKPFPYVKQALTRDALTLQVKELVALHESGLLLPQYEAAQFIRTRYDERRCIGDIVSAWDRAISSKRRGAQNLVSSTTRAS